MSDKAEEIVEKIIADLCDRRGLRHTWDSIDEDTQQEIRNTWITIVKEVSGHDTEVEDEEEKKT